MATWVLIGIVALIVALLIRRKSRRGGLMGKGRPTGRIVGTTEIKTFVLHFEAGKHALEVAKEPRPGSFYHCLHCITSTAFGLEAYMNHLGFQLFPSETEAFKWRPPEEKLQAVCTKLRIAPDMGARPYQAFPQAFAARKLAAHSETVFVAIDQPAPPRDRMPPPEKSPLELECTIAKAERLFTDGQAIVRDLHRQTGKSDDPFFGVTFSSYVETFPPDPIP